MTWTAPSIIGGSPITSYEVSVDDGTNWESTNNTNTNYTVNGLTNGTNYTIKVRAVNVVGAGVASDPNSYTRHTCGGYLHYKW